MTSAAVPQPRDQIRAAIPHAAAAVVIAVRGAIVKQLIPTGQQISLVVREAQLICGRGCGDRWLRH